MKQLHLHPLAVFEVNEALHYYRAAEADGVADDLHDRINAALNALASHPTRWPLWEKTRFRRYVIGRFPYVIFYDDQPERIYVLAVAHASRRPGYWKKRISS